MLADQKKTQLSRFLGQVPDDVATNLAKAVEIDRLIGNTGLPHDEILNALRPQLKKAAVVARTPTPQRFFCRPFEDLLVADTRGGKRKGRIARASIQPVWTWLGAELMPEAHAALTTGIRFAILNNRDDDVAAKCAELWSASSSAMKKALVGERAKTQAAKKLGNMGTVEDAAEIAVILGAAPTMLALQEALPRPLAALSEDYLLTLRELYDRLVASDPDAAPYIAIIAMRRLAKPHEALRLAAVVSRRTAGTVIGATDLGAAGELLFDDLEALAVKIQGARAADFEINALLENLVTFVELSSGIVKELGIGHGSKWGQRLGKSRSAVAAAMEALLERAPNEILAALPRQPLDLVHAPDGECVVRAMRYACLMAYATPYAVAASFSAKLNEKMDETAVALRAIAEELLEAVRTPGPEAQPHAEQYFEIAADLCAQILGPEDTELLRRRARVTAA